MRPLETLRRERPMPKNESQPQANVVWRLLNDAMRPKEAPWGFVAQNPFQRVVPPGQSITIDTGIAANVPLICVPRGDQASYVSVPLALPAGQTVKVTVRNESVHVPMVIDDGEAICNLTPLVYTGTSTVD